MKNCLFILTGFGIFISTECRSQATFPVNGTTDPRHITYAFIHSKIVVDYKTSMDSATFIVRDGIIVDEGKNLATPPGAVVYDLKGKYIYPSFIDLFSDYGLPEIKKPQPGDGSPQFNSATKGAYNWNQAIRSEYDAFKNFSVDQKKSEELRKLGFGAVNIINKDGIARGTSALVTLGEGKENDVVIRDRCAANYSFDKGTSMQDYPESLMGAIALLRQTYYDAQWYSNGGYKKEFNISLDAWNATQSLPQIFDAGDKQNEFRADKIGDEFSKKFIIKGAGDEYQRISEIKAMNDALIVPLNFPEAYDLSDPYDAINISLSQMKHWELAPTNPSSIEKAQIDFALTTSDLKDKNNFWKNLRKAIDYGLSEQAALKALTLTPSELLRSSDVVGSLRKGMMANFIITSKNIFDKENVILDNWVKGVRYKINEYEMKDIRGTYSLEVKNHAALKLKVTGDISTPEMKLFEDTIPVNVSYTRQGTLITLQYELKKKETKGTYRLSGYVNEDNPVAWYGNALVPGGEWVNWQAKLDSVFIPVTKKDTSKKEIPDLGAVTYPMMAYGWKEIPKAKTVLIKNATVWTNEADGILANADVLISEGKIKQVGKNLSSPGAEVIDGTGKHLTSGIIDEHSHIAVTDGVNEGTESASAEVRIADVIDADDIQIYRQLAGGVTSSHILHGSANAIGGQTQLIKERWGFSPEKLKFDADGMAWPGFIKFALGENVKQANWGDKQVYRFPQTRMGVEQVYNDFFTRAREYENEWKKFNAPDSKIKNKDVPPRKNLKLDALVEILNSKRFITCHSYEQSEINMLMHVADSFGFKINTFTHILEGYKVADKMKSHGVRGASSFSDWWAYKYEVYEAIPYNGAIMHDMGLTVSFNSDDPEMARRLNQEAAKAVKYGGVSEEEAWKFVTLNPAKILRVDQRVGSVKAGKDADLVLWNENPLSIYAKPLQTYVDGIRFYDVDADQQLRDENRKERARLIQKMADAKNKGEGTQKPAMKAQVIHHCDEDEYLLMK
ncbi:MAG: amidohydrolase family protein [Bacteroidetes bacterium]|nr:amidohydrolase family protein [Bacteroidota bacterium]